MQIPDGTVVGAWSDVVGTETDVVGRQTEARKEPKVTLLARDSFLARAPAGDLRSVA
jgi:hypothetical protein